MSKHSYSIIQTFSMDKGSHLKIGFVGEQGVGKTHILNRFLMNRLPSNPASTIAVEFATTIYQMKDGTRFKVEIWDTAGHEKYKEIVCVHLKNADAIVIVYDLLNRKSFEEVKSWIDKIKAECEGDPVLLMFGNKIDLVERNPANRKVETEEGRSLAESNGIVFYETTAKKLQGIQSALEEMLETVVLNRAVKNLESLRERIDNETETPACNVCILF